ncbi:type I 3-dehydroquinate dehydratase [Periweissella fabalis]|uniref:3-dehydroquinate dehydratase n=1 Tax=Periweissella fabalis TaxID=1070421 RepID=A0A7X6N0B5_9LACO|nr:type I 3-dehydroquinate dehydratase [Periweissella fabalis]MCM0599092.1 type I 3-dehydroquinate dehydratase [Periweissella fabalis]NKZ23371.1 type I 3-dehydroquinate dehydratase [Periweissella fabalis]
MLLPTNRMAIAVSISGKSQTDIVNQIAECQKYPIDLIEWRLDVCLAAGYRPTAMDMQSIITTSSVPMILTYRTTAEGGEYPFEPHLYTQLYLNGWQAGATFLDVEYQIWPKVSAELAGQKSAIIMSYHNFEITPNNLLTKIQAMAQARPAMIKIAVMSHGAKDTDYLLRTIASYQSIPMIGIAMGAAGARSRTAGFAYGSRITYTTLPSTAPMAPGQIDLPTLITVLHKGHPRF